MNFLQLIILSFKFFFLSVLYNFQLSKFFIRLFQLLTLLDVFLFKMGFGCSHRIENFFHVRKLFNLMLMLSIDILFGSINRIKYLIFFIDDWIHKFEFSLHLFFLSFNCFNFLFLLMNLVQLHFICSFQSLHFSL